ncbi:MAG: TlpA family protein disulfide reductase [Chromatiales bacterium]|nr:TlpA family protein disulfide reductase [Chromatiales bacterium]
MENKRDLVIVVVLAIVGLTSGLALQSWLSEPEPLNDSSGRAAPTTQAPATRPDFTLMDTTGKLRNVAEWDGKVMVVNFWATWCPPCRREIPSFIELQNELGPRGLQFVGVAIDDADKVRTFTDKFAFNYPSLHGESDADAVSSRYGNREGVLPYSVVVDRQGNLIYVHRGLLSKDKLLSVVTPLL